VKSSTKNSAKPKKQAIPSIEFSLYAPDAKEVFLAGDFNNWDDGKDRMRKFKTGFCTKKVKLKPGRYQYRFVVDGEWLTDPENSERETNEFGSENSVITVSS